MLRATYSVMTLRGVNITISDRGEEYTCTLNKPDSEHHIRSASCATDRKPAANTNHKINCQRVNDSHLEAGRYGCFTTYT